METLATAAKQHVRPLRILFCVKRFGDHKPWESLSRTVLVPHVIEACMPNDVEEALASFQPEVLVPWWIPIPAKYLRDTPSLKFIQQFGVGVENIDISAATEQGIWVARLASGATGNADTVAEHTVMLMLATARHLLQAHRTVQEGQVVGRPHGAGLMGKTVCIVGFGDIGHAIARRLGYGWGMKITAVRRRAEDGIPAAFAEKEFIHKLYGMNQLDQALAEADFTVLAIKYDPAETHHLFSKPMFDKMKRGSILVNIARGGLINSLDLLEALKSGQLGGAGLDVFEEEPIPATHPLQGAPNVVFTPHVGAAGDLFYEGGLKAFKENVDRFASGFLPLWCINAPKSPKEALRQPALENGILQVEASAA
ncbi:hypothetical protein BZG36_02940 [Bifiguratus adelaidae]|uniref:D-isomer specific 2-hydroxyacid dehydrogenase NAD-binding domain-containing protein n=1 Tax=Bifiguratus adelaidae TaxID=1938954 RepID=A0A261Y005_9FUNG|nr:hypothetical protein BZG36_02940 [Bifiguratus adelaidae]